MVNKWLQAVGIALLLSSPGLLAAPGERLANGIFVLEDSDQFDPGIAVGEKFPPIGALHDGAEVTDIMAFGGQAGLVVVTNRSVEW